MLQHYHVCKQMSVAFTYSLSALMHSQDLLLQWGSCVQACSITGHLISH